MQGFRIRRLSIKDALDFRDIRLEGLQNHPEAFGADFEEERSQTIQWFADRLTNNAVFGGFNDAGDLCGVVAVACGRSLKTQHNASIWGMYVEASSRGTGMSKLLLEAAIENAFEHCQSIRLAVVASNIVARSLYTKAGFREWATDVAALRVGDVFHDETMMRFDKSQFPATT